MKIVVKDMTQGYGSKVVLNSLSFEFESGKLTTVLGPNGSGKSTLIKTICNIKAMAVIGSNKPSNMIHVVINNGAHETVGGMPTVAGSIDIVAIAKACGYPNAVCVDNFEDLDKELENAKARNELSLIEVKCSIGARDDLGRPTTTALENKEGFMDYIK